MSDKIVLIDGHSILHRAYYGIPSLSNSKGFPTNAIYGFLNIMFKVLDEEKPSHLAIAFDKHAPTFRHLIYKEYKGTRKPMPDDLRPQVPKIIEVLESMNILVMSKDGLEADDLIGTMSRRCEAKGMDVSIISGDRDLLQLSTDKVLVRIPKTKSGKTEIENYYPDDVRSKYSVSPLGIIDLKSLMGDTSDNIPGVPSIGEKTATNLLVKYETLDNIYKHIDEITPPRAKKALEENEDLARLSYTLATINVDADIDFDIDQAKINNFYNDKSYDVFKELELKKYYDRFENDIKLDNIEKIEINIIDANSNNCSQLLDAGLVNDKISFCFVSDNLNTNQYLGVGITSKLGSQYINIEDNESLNGIKNLILELIKNNKIIVFGIQQIIETLDLSINPEYINNIIDTKLINYELDPIKSEYSIEDISQNFGNVSLDGITDSTNHALYCSLGIYNSVDTLINLISAKELDSVYYNIDLPLAFILLDMKKNGIKVIKQELSDYSEALNKSINELSDNIYSECGEEFNINSPKQLGVILFEKLELPVIKKTKTGYSTSADILNKLAIDYPIVNNILKYRTFSKLKSTYADGLRNYISDDNRIHGNFHQTITATGRISSSDPNLQNIPIRINEGKLLRKVFVPKDGYIFIDADYSQIELRVLAHMSGDEGLIRDFNEGKDIHQITASKAFGINIDEVTEDDRRKAKAINFGIVYGMSAFGLGEDLGISSKEAKEYIAKYFETYPKVKEFLDSQVEFAKENAYVKTMFGRIRPIPEIKDSNFMRRSFGERIAMNSPIQGTAADIMKIAMHNVYKSLKDNNLKSRIVLQVHDELLIETHNDEIDIVSNIVRNEMENAAKLSVPLIVDIGKGNNWLDAH